MDIWTANDAIQASTMADGVYDRLREAIMSGNLPPGTRLVEANLARSLRVSRTPLREAFRRLERERLVERVSAGGGVRVPSLTTTELEHLADIRRLVEGQAARKAGSRVREGDLTPDEYKIFERMEQIADMMSRLVSPTTLEEYLRLGREFHSCIYRLSGNPWYEHVMRQVLDAQERYRTKSVSDRHLLAVDEHRAIMRAILEGDEIRAETLVHEHLDEVRQLHRAGVGE